MRSSRALDASLDSLVRVHLHLLGVRRDVRHLHLAVRNGTAPTHLPVASGKLPGLHWIVISSHVVSLQLLSRLLRGLRIRRCSCLRTAVGDMMRDHVRLWCVPLGGWPELCGILTLKRGVVVVSLSSWLTWLRLRLGLCLRLRLNLRLRLSLRLSMCLRLLCIRWHWRLSC